MASTHRQDVGFFSSSATQWKIIAALSALSMSTLIVEVCLTKFLGIKLYYHFAYILLGTVVLSFGLAGTSIYLRNGVLGKDTDTGWAACAQVSAYYAIAMALAVILLCWIPISPITSGGHEQPYLGLVALPMYFLLLAVPLFFAGLAISHVLTASSLAVTTVYFWDLLAAGVGALVSPLLLQALGGYGSIFVAVVLAVIASIFFQRASRTKVSRGPLLMWVVASAAALTLYSYPSLSVQTYGFDIRATKDPYTFSDFMECFHGLAFTHWNAVARVDVSKTGTSESLPFFRFGLASDVKMPKLSGRLIMVDGAANTRQFLLPGPVKDQKYLENFLWSSPYVAHGETAKALIIGGGGGVDILIGKLFGVKNIDVLEFNPANARLLKGQIDDPGQTYSQLLLSDSDTRVNVLNVEARHFCTTQPAGLYDVIQASGVDTLTAVSSGGLVLADNYLYTQDAVESFARLLKPGGILSLTHWRTFPPAYNLRMFLTYLSYLDKQGVKEPWKHTLVVSGPYWTDSMMKTTPFTQQEVERVEQWAHRTRQFLLFNPLAPDQPDKQATPDETIFGKVAMADPARRAAIVNGYKMNVVPSTDDKPYFYNVNAAEPAVSLPVNTLAALVEIAALCLIFLPLIRLKKSDFSATAPFYVIFFAACGFAFFLFETMIIQHFCILVGGPIYSLSVVLVAVLVGYALGALVAQRLKATALTLICVTTLLCLVFASLWIGIHSLIQLLLPLHFAGRMLAAALVSGGLALLTGIPVTLVMHDFREKHGNLVAWMWGISSACNALGALFFVPMAQVVGVSAIGLIVGVLYLVAGLCFALACRYRKQLVLAG